MPLRDHFRPPVDDQHSWEELHGQWPAVIVQQLRPHLPPGFIAGPRVHPGSQIEVDVATYEKDNAPPFAADTSDGGGAVAVWAEPTVEVEALLDFDEYEVRVYDVQRGRRLVAAVEIVSPANKDRPESRRAFVAKCSALIQQGVAVSIVDLVTTKRFNLFLDLLETIGHTDPTLGDPPPPTYAASCRAVKRGKKTLFQARSHHLELGRPLPTLPLWLDSERVVPLDLEASYEQACHDLWIA
ncbi:DUF4058 family protein [Limnoglobus roseus]|uniref:DUF4058 domain-containing protein n=1 Tax=Limnoglobus roseus TaxID=2598579 RepID=A0A5C1AE53_9BACT|nr:DUF4058 family protein [Limnoglobus roseus]QEL15992.1 hypothetical protein PX52LOC_02929 [Limnoglobus roseus]